MSVLVLGAGGIVGQTMRLCQPPGVRVQYVRREDDPVHVGCHLEDRDARAQLLRDFRPDVIVNLAGESRPDVVERAPDRYVFINVELPQLLAAWCRHAGSHLVHVSTQAVFNGTTPPYYPDSPRAAVNAYGAQKIAAERQLAACTVWGPTPPWTIVRLTFVLGIRPLPFVGRANPLESMLQATKQTQVRDRWFSPLMAWDAARVLWQTALDPRPGQITHAGIPQRSSRFLIATAAKRAQQASAVVVPVSHSAYPGLAERPYNTTYGLGSVHYTTLDAGLRACVGQWRDRLDYWSLDDRACELSIFFGREVAEAYERLGRGFLYNHAQVAEDWRRTNPQTDEEILTWYRQTDTYVWELTAYHLDAGFNYRGMAQATVDRLLSEGVRKILVLGDGIGDLSLLAADAGIDTTYHDLGGSVTHRFAKFRIWRRNLQHTVKIAQTHGWTPDLPDERYDAVIAFDFFEHLTDVDSWVHAAVARLRPGGWLVSQNGFAIGDEEHGGSIPMHLSRNNRFERDWDPLLDSLGLQAVSDGWRRKRLDAVPV